MLEAILLAAGRRAVAAGNVGRPLVDVVTAAPTTAPAYDVLAVELSSFQLHWSSVARARRPPRCSTSPTTTLDWHGSFAAYRDAKARILRGARGRGRQTPATRWPRALVGRAPAPRSRSPSASRRPASSASASGALVDRAFAADPAGEVLLDAGRPAGPPGRTTSVNALAAAALARAAGVPAEAVGRGLAGVPPAARTATPLVATVGGVRLRRRQQGDQPARRRRLAGRLPARGLDRRRPAQGRRRRSAGRRGRRPAGRRGPAGPRPGRDRRVAGATRPDGPRGRRSPAATMTMDGTARRRGDDAGSSPPRPSWPGPGTRCCSRRPPPRWTCSRDYAHRGQAFAAAVAGAGRPARDRAPPPPRAGAAAPHRRARPRPERRGSAARPGWTAR